MSTGASPWRNDGPAHPLLLDMSALVAAGVTHTTKPSPFAAVTGSDRTFTDTKALGPEIFRLKEEAGRQDGPLRAAVQQQIVMRQAEWVAKAKSESLREPAGVLDPVRATPSEVANAFLWSEAGGVIPRDELARDGGRAFLTSVRDAVVRQTHGFEAMLDLHAGRPNEQTALLGRELQRLGVSFPADANVDALRGLWQGTTLARSRAELNREQVAEGRQLYIGLDGHVGTADGMDTYERQQALAAMSPGTTLGSMMATFSCIAQGGIDLERMRAMGNAGSAVEGMLGGAGVHMNGAASAREPAGQPKPNTDDFNRTGLRPRFQTKRMNEHYAGESVPGNEIWNRGATKTREVKYVARHSDRAAYKLEAREVIINGKKETRLHDANGTPFDTRTAEAHDGATRAIFVMNAQGEVFSSTYQEAAYMHHSSLSGGAPVAAAGELMVEHGKVVGITNRSGHYQPGPEFTNQLVRSLRDQGLDLTGVPLTLYGADGSHRTTVLP